MRLSTGAGEFNFTFGWEKMTDLDSILESVWFEQVASRYIYRGMSQSDLSDPLDPQFNPHGDVLPLLRDFFDLLQRLIDSGFRLTLVEKHWERSWEHYLKNILAWSKRDLNQSSLDFHRRL